MDAITIKAFIIHLSILSYSYAFTSFSSRPFLHHCIDTFQIQTRHEHKLKSQFFALSQYFENDLVSINIGDANMTKKPKLFVVMSDGTLSPLCQHEDDNPTDFYVDPRTPTKGSSLQNPQNGIIEEDSIDDDDVLEYYGEGWYSQRVVPSLGGGPGYGAEADPIWTIDEDVLEKMILDQVDIPILDLGIAHGEKARGGAI